MKLIVAFLFVRSSGLWFLIVFVSAVNFSSETILEVKVSGRTLVRKLVLNVQVTHESTAVETEETSSNTLSYMIV